MTRFHQWKGRLQNQTEGYPFVNGPPFRVAGQGRFPVEAGGEPPQNGVNIVVADFPGAEVTFTVSGTANRAMTLVWSLSYVDNAGAEKTDKGQLAITNGQTAAAIATAWAAQVSGLVSSGDLTIGAAAGVVTITVVDEGTQLVNGYYTVFANA